MFKRARILSLAAAIAVMMAQPAWAVITITPVDKQVSQEKQQNQPGSAVSTKKGLTVSGVYSTKEPVTVKVTVTAPESADTTGPSGNSGTSAGSNTGPGFEEETVAETTDSADTTAAAQPEKPEIFAESAILYDATNNKVLFEKQADKKLYPASITKIMTALLVLENSGLNEKVTFTSTAVSNLESGAVSLGITAGETFSVENCLYALLLKSANEVANGLAEHVSGSISDFAKLMNAKAKALGCTNTNFVNPNGLNNSNHYTTCRDMALIAKAAFENETLCKIASTLSYKFPATKNSEARTLTPGHKMLYPSDSRYYEGIIGGKTGYTSLAGNTLVTCVEKNGVRLITVVLKASGTHYADTKKMLDYGYALKAAESASTSGNKTSSSESKKTSSGPTSAAKTETKTETKQAWNKWIADGSSWRFEYADGSRAADCLITVDGADYVFDSAGIMLTGWRKYDGIWYYFKSSGAMAKNSWQLDGGLWYYLGSDGAMMTSAWVDNNRYYVGESGAWIENYSQE